MPWRIKKPNEDLYLASEIDPGGMSVYWTSLERADVYATKSSVLGMETRLLERYAKDEYELYYTAD